MLTGRRNTLPKESPKRNIQKEKIEKKIRDKNISSILSFIHLVKGLTNATSWDVAWCPKHQTAKWCCWFDGHCLKRERSYRLLFQEENPFFFLCMHHLLFH